MPGVAFAASAGSFACLTVQRIRQVPAPSMTSRQLVILPAMMLATCSGVAVAVVGVGVGVGVAVVGVVVGVEVDDSPPDPHAASAAQAMAAAMTPRRAFISAAWQGPEGGGPEWPNRQALLDRRGVPSSPCLCRTSVRVCDYLGRCPKDDHRGADGRAGVDGQPEGAP